MGKLISVEEEVEGALFECSYLLVDMVFFHVFLKFSY